MLTTLELLLPLLLIGVISLPLINVFRGKTTAKSAKTRVVTHIALFFLVLVGVLVYNINGASVLAAEGESADLMSGTLAQGLGFIAAALATGMSGLGAGIAVAAAGPAAFGGFSENDKNFGKSLIFVALGEGVAIYGLIISILIIMIKL